MRLRALEPEDLELLYTIENSPEMWDVGASAMPYSRHALRQHIRLQGDSLEENGCLRFVIEDADAPVGLIDLINYNARASRAEVSIALLRSHRGQGLASAALEQLEHFCRNYTHLHQLYALIPEGNTASAQLFRRCGFLHTSTLADWHFQGGGYQNVLLFQKILQKNG